MNKVEFTTARGSKISVEIVTETANLADHNVTNRCYELEVRANGNLFLLAAQYSDGKIVTGNNIIPVPAESQEAVSAIFAEYNTESTRRADEIAAEDEQYERHVARINRAMNP